MAGRHACQCNWDLCSNYKAKYDKHGSIFQKGIFQLRFSKSKKNKEFRSLICQLLGIKNNNKSTLYIANYHWNPKLLEFLGTKYRTTLLSKEEAKLFGISCMKNSFNKEGNKFYAVPMYTKASILIEIQSFNSLRSQRLKKQKVEELNCNIVTPT